MMEPVWMGRPARQRQSWMVLHLGMVHQDSATWGHCHVVSYQSASQSHSVSGQPGCCCVKLPSGVLPLLGAPQAYSMSGQLGHYH